MDKHTYLKAMSNINMPIDRKLAVARGHIDALETNLETSTDNVMKLSAKIDKLSTKLEMFIGRFYDGEQMDYVYKEVFEPINKIIDKYIDYVEEAYT